MTAAPLISVKEYKLTDKSVQTMYSFTGYARSHHKNHTMFYQYRFLFTLRFTPNILYRNISDFIFIYALSRRTHFTLTSHSLPHAKYL